MRITFLALALASLTACSVHTSPSLDPLVTLIREQNDQIKALQEQMTSLQAQIQRPDRAEATELGPLDRRVYRMVSGRVIGDPKREVVYIIEHQTGRMLAFVFIESNHALEVVAGASLATAGRRPDRRRGLDDQSRVPTMHLLGQSILAVPAGPEDEAIFIVDDATEKLMIYLCDPNRKRLTLVRTHDLRAFFFPESSPGRSDGVASP